MSAQLDDQATDLAGTTDDEVIRTIDLTKVYPGTDRKAVDRLNLSVRRGEIFGLLGPNGAGKTTTAGMLATRVIPTSGQAIVGGIDVVAHPALAKQVIGAVTQQNTLDRALTVWENLYYHGRLFGMPTKDSRAAADELHRGGQTIMLTTHYMEEADQLCERLAIMDHGKILALDTPAGLKASVGADSIITVRASGDLAELAGVLRSIDGVSSATNVDGSIIVHVKGASSVLPPIVISAERHGFVVHDLSVAEPTLETVFINLTGKELRD